jgi:TRAP-type uncharacterized transport system substrate-binding protein
MPAELPHRPLAMKLWLSKSFGQAKHDANVGIESLEHLMRNRMRMLLRHTWIVAVLGTLIIGGLIWWVVYITVAPTDMKIAAGPAGSANVTLVQLLTQRFVTERDKVRLSLVPTDGPQQSLQTVTSKDADLAIIPSTIDNSPDLPVVAILRQNVMALIVPAPPPPPTQPKQEVAKEVPPPVKKEAAPPEKPEKAAAAKGAKAAAKTTKGAKTAKNEKVDKDNKKAKGAKAADKDAKTAENGADKDEDVDADDKSSAASGGDSDAAAAASNANKLDKVSKLAGHRVAVVTGNEATPELLNIVLNHYGVPAAQVQISLIDPKDVADAVKAQQVDVLFVAGAATGRAINDVVTAATQNGQPPSFIAIDQAEGIAKRNLAFNSIDIPAGTFGGNPPMPDDELTTLSFGEYLVARKSFSHDGVANLARLIFTSRLALAAAMPGEVKIEAPSTDKDSTVVVHPGALAYLGDDQKTFFDKYGDDIFYGLLIFPIFGSAIAGVASYFRSSGRTKRLRLLQGLLDQVRKAHNAPTLEALDRQQGEVDRLVIAIIHQTETEEYDQTVQMSFSLALDHVRFAIASRRAVLLGTPDNETSAETQSATETQFAAE